MMKKAVFVLSTILLVSCSGNKNNDDFEEIRKIEGDITRENVENLVRTGMKDKPLYSSVKIQKYFSDKENFENNQLIQKLISDSLLRYKVSDGIHAYTLDEDYDKFKKYKMDNIDYGFDKVATYRLEFDSLITVQEIPFMNATQADIRVRRTEEGTPYKILDTITPETMEIGIGIVKDIDGWIYKGHDHFELKSDNQ